MRLFYTAWDLQRMNLHYCTVFLSDKFPQGADSRIKPEAEFLDKIRTKVLGFFLFTGALQLCLEIYISSNLHNLLRMSSNSRNLLSISSNSRNLLCISTVQLLNTIKEKWGKPDRKPCPFLYVLRNACTQKPQVWELSTLCPETSTKLFMNSASAHIMLYRQAQYHNWASPSSLSHENVVTAYVKSLHLQ